MTSDTPIPVADDPEIVDLLRTVTLAKPAFRISAQQTLTAGRRARSRHRLGAFGGAGLTGAVVVALFANGPTEQSPPKPDGVAAQLEQGTSFGGRRMPQCYLKADAKSPFTMMAEASPPGEPQTDSSVTNVEGAKDKCATLWRWGMFTPHGRDTYVAPDDGIVKGGPDEQYPPPGRPDQPVPGLFVCESTGFRPAVGGLMPSALVFPALPGGPSTCGEMGGMVALIDE